MGLEVVPSLCDATVPGSFQQVLADDRKSCSPCKWRWAECLGKDQLGGLLEQVLRSNKKTWTSDLCMRDWCQRRLALPGGTPFFVLPGLTQNVDLAVVHHERTSGCEGTWVYWGILWNGQTRAISGSFP